MKHLFILLLQVFPVTIFAQFVAPAASPPAESSVTIGYTDVKISYHRPNVRGRKVFGELVPWNEIWRAGANENTLLTFGGDVRIGNVDVPAGTYSVFLIPANTGKWTWIINKTTDGWGARKHDAATDVVRLPAKTTELPEREETLGYRWRNVGPNGAELTLEWEFTRVVLPVTVATDAEVARRAETHLNPAEDPKAYYAAARYYLDNDLDLRQAKNWMDRWAAEDEEQFGRMRYQAIIERKLGNNAAAERLMWRSLELARAAGNDHYVRMNDRSLRAWMREPVDVTADTLLARSIRYHDPAGNWPNGPHALQLAESRPGGIVNHSQLTLYPAGNAFDLVQIRGRNITRSGMLNGKFAYTRADGSEVSAADREALRLTPERTETLRNYYTYLYGLPMKIRDPGAQVQPRVHKVWFNGAEVLELEVRYAPDTGKDRWFFYFDQESYALVGYAFYPENKGPGTGEYITLEGEALVDGMRLPAERHWFYTHDNLYLGTDSIIR